MKKDNFFVFTWNDKANRKVIFALYIAPLLAYWITGIWDYYHRTFDDTRWWIFVIACIPAMVLNIGLIINYRKYLKR